MKLQLDTDKKTIKLESDVKISKLISTLKKLLPNGEYKEFTLETNTVIQRWSSPIIIHEHWKQWEPVHPWQPWYTVGDTTDNYRLTVSDNSLRSLTGSLQLKSGVYDLEI